MKTSGTNPKVDTWLARQQAWQEETRILREIVLGVGLDEELKWNKPCYSFEGRNVVLIIGLKESCALMFCKGALLKDAKKILRKPGEHTQAGRWIKFTSAREVTGRKGLLKAYVRETVAVEKAGLQVTFKSTADYAVPEEFKRKLSEVPSLKKAFEALTPGRQRGYLLHFAGAKQSQTREARIEKCRRRILEGKGLND